MTTFKDLLKKDELATLKSYGEKSNKPITTSEKPERTNLPTAKKVSTTTKRLGTQYVDDDKVLFMQAMAGVTPLKNTIAIAKTPQKDPNSAFRRASAMGGQEDVPVAISDMQALLNPVASEAFLSYKQPTLQHKVFEQLKQGKLRWYEAVDLHATSIDEARQAVLELIQIAKHANQTVIKIVHGKGDALIKTCVNGWLRQLPEVLAFVSAPAKDGGTGAVLVLLKKPRTYAQPH